MYQEQMVFLEIVIPKIKKIIEQDVQLLFKHSEENILIDTSPDLRQQLLRHRIKKIDKVLYSHMHGDQTHGINDLRSFYINTKKQINVYADTFTSKYLTRSFSYMFQQSFKRLSSNIKIEQIK